MRTIRTTLVPFCVVTGLVALMPVMAGAQKTDRDLITREDILHSATKAQDLYQAIRVLRPHFFAGPRGVRSMKIERGGPVGMQNSSKKDEPDVPAPVVYINGTKSGDPEVLKGILTQDVEEVRYLNPNKASMEYGIGHEGGAILVTMYKGPKPPSSAAQVQPSRP